MHGLKWLKNVGGMKQQQNSFRGYEIYNLHFDLQLKHWAWKVIIITSEPVTLYQWKNSDIMRFSLVKVHTAAILIRRVRRSNLRWSFSEYVVHGNGRFSFISSKNNRHSHSYQPPPPLFIEEGEKEKKSGMYFSHFLIIALWRW